MKRTKRKGFNFFRSYFDVYNELEGQAKIDFIDALLNKQFLNKDPEDLKGMAKFAYISQVNSIESQVKGYNDKQKHLKRPLLGEKEPPAHGGCDGGKTPPAIQEKEKEKEKVQVEVKEKKETVFNFRKELITSGAKQDLVLDWLKVRKTKKATNTKTALKSFLHEVEKSNSDLNEILKKCIENSWSGFKNSWLQKEKPKIENENISKYQANLNALERAREKIRQNAVS